ncbi:hemerythrin domain-containing protein [Flaviaesturariibacter aridisoli]|uniref:Hemerythrin-like domain-containing protein n=1 Tax=Flaviaesturariibacter aridisoli TaxID=2545761 RepID=A0A4R4E2J1_9BACT|nr:hemerythrin domain-containing protein [Flaviaesturariibacter aridisoli]TCZ72993.1 hypothetical protein E0486_07980 [Flaviaesturariibacter aridisoli]
MKRTNFFLLIHQALRRLLFDTAQLLQQTDFSNEDAASAALDAVRETILLFETHAAHEDRYILPAVADYEPSVADCFAREHAEDHRIGCELLAAAEAVTVADAAARAGCGVALQQAYRSFLAFNLQHMDKEERILNDLLLRYYTVAQVMGMQFRIVQSTPPWIHDRIAHWMLLGNNEADTVQWLKTVAAGAPQLTYDTLLQKAEALLPPARWASLRRRLEITPVFA